MKTKEEIIAVIDNTNHLSCEDCVAIKHHLTQPTLNPMKIDEERLVRAWKTTPSIKEAIKYYNSTCKDHQVLQPLPKDKPDWFEWSLDTSKYDLWDELVKTYGTPTKKELPSVEELDEEICALHRVIMPATSKLIAQHLVNKYSLPSKKEEWWMNLKEGERFVNGNKIMESDGCIYLFGRGEGVSDVNDCSPYTEPSAREKLKAKGVTDDEINELINQHEKQEFMKEVKGC